MKTPWGKSLGYKRVTTGITFFDTAGHGGYRISPAMNAKIPAKWRLDGEFEGWYEEDCGWAPLALTFPEAFPGVPREDAERMISWWESWVSKTRRINFRTCY